MTREQQKDFAKTIFINESNVTQQEIADRVGVSRITINTWAKEWGNLKLNLLQTRDARIYSTLQQLEELDQSIANKGVGKRFPSPAEADTRRKLTSDLEALEQEASIRDIYSVSRRFLDWLRGFEFDKAQELSDFFDAFIHEKMKK